MCYSEAELPNIVTRVPQGRWNSFCLEKATDLLSVSIITGFEIPQKKWPNTLNAKNIARNSLA